MKAGYSFWGFLGDEKFDSSLCKLSTPDGNAFYSWSIIQALQNQGIDVQFIMPDRDCHGYFAFGKELFKSWATEKRESSYLRSKRLLYIDVNLRSEECLFRYWDEFKVYDCDFILHEWRMEIKGRNDIDSINNDNWQPDLFLQNCLLKYCQERDIPLIIFDLDYKLNEKQIAGLKKVAIIELGKKWESKNIHSRRVYIPFDFGSINEFDLKEKYKSKLVYIGNRYERDWCIDKYIPVNQDGIIVYGNWNEGGRDSSSKWPSIKFGKRLQTNEMHEVYSSSATTILFAKREYCDQGFMTARLIESIFYGSVPLFISEYGNDVINDFAGKYAEVLTVNSSDEVIKKINLFYEDYNFRNGIIKYLRHFLDKMDAIHFAEEVVSLYEEIKNVE